MAQPCRTCGHPRRREIHALREERGATFPALSAEFGIPGPSIWRHFESKVCRARWQAKECAPEAAQAVAAAAREVTQAQAAAPAPAPAPRRRAIAPSPRPATPPDDDRGGEVVPFVRPGIIAAETPRSEPVPVVKQIADLLELGYTHDDVGHQLSIGGGEMAEYIATIENAKRTLLAKSAEDWGASLVWSCMSRLARYRRRQIELEAALRHREADRFDDKIVAAERDLRKMLTELGRLGPVDLSELERQPNSMDDIFGMVKNSAEGVFREMKGAQDRKQIQLG